MSVQSVLHILLNMILGHKDYHLFLLQHLSAAVGLQLLSENNGVLCVLTVNPSALHAADLMGLCSDSAERGCSFSVKWKQRRYCISSNKMTLLSSRALVMAA